MNVLFVVSEAVPFIKTGGLADVAGSLPKALKKLGENVAIILPKYSIIPEKWKKEMTRKQEINVKLSWRNQYCGLEMAVVDGVVYYFVDNEYYFRRHSLYGNFDDGERFSYFCRAVLDLLPYLHFSPDILHCHDWHTGMIPFLLKYEYHHLPFYQNIKTIFTIHNLKFQGVFPKKILGDVLGVSDVYFTPKQLEFYGQVNFMKAALVSSDIITTVSPTYKNEILTTYYGENMDGILRERSDSVVGILNGIDEEMYNPATDPLIFEQYDVQTCERKVMNKRRLQADFGLSMNEDTPVIAVISRLTKQKGMDLVKRIFQEVMRENIQFVILGTGDAEFEQFFQAMEYSYPEKTRTIIGFDEGLAHKIYAGSDLFLMPSQFEPCGLSQLIALKYGTIPIVRETGGLNDTVTSYNEYTNEGNGFSFTNFNAHDMLYTVKRAIQIFQNKTIWNQLIKKAIMSDYSWTHSALEYRKLYTQLTSKKTLSE